MPGPRPAALRDVACNRYKVLAATCLLTFGSYYCFDMPSVVENQLTHSVVAQASFARTNPGVWYNLFYTVYAWTNCAMSLVAGVLVDKWGLEKCAFLFLSFCLVGQALYALGPTLGGVSGDARYVIMFVGRFIFGLGGGSITIAQNVISAHWFKNRELAMAFGCTLTMSRLGSVLNFSLTNWLFSTFFAAFYEGDGDPSVVVAGCGAKTTRCGGHHNLTAAAEGAVASPSPGPLPPLPPSPVNPDIVDACRESLAATFWAGAGLVLLSFFAAAYWLSMHRADLRHEQQQQQQQEAATGLAGAGADKPAPAKKKMKLSDIRKMPLVFWIVVICICSFYCLVFPFMAVAPKFLADDKLSVGCADLADAAACEKCFANAQAESGSYASIVYLMSAVVSPFLGGAVDYFGRRGYLAVLSTAATLPVFLLLAYTDVTPALPMVLLGLAYCGCAATLWPTIQFLVDPVVVGTANGLATSVQMLGIGICNAVVGAIMDANGENYKPLMLFFTGMSALSLACAVALKLRSGGRLYEGARDRQRKALDQALLGSFDDDSGRGSVGGVGGGYGGGYGSGGGRAAEPPINGLASPNTAVANMLSPSAGAAMMGGRRGR